jgi:serine/threonine protein kinase
MAELIARKPLFPGESSMHQLKLIVTLLGLSSTDDLKWMDNPKAVEHVLSLGVIPKASLKKLFPNTCSAGVDLLTSMLEFNPSKRISIKNALSHPFFSEFHGTQQALPDASSLFDFEFDKIQHSKQTLQDFVWEEIYKFRPFLRPLGPNLTDQHYTVMRERMARKKLAKEELHKKQQLKIAADRLKELKPAGLTIAVPSELKRVPSIVAVPPGVTLPPIVAVQSASVSVSAISSDDGTIALPGQLSGYISHSTQSVVGAPLDAQTVKPSGYISYSSTGGATAPPAKKKDQHKETDAEVANINMPSAI